MTARAFAIALAEGAAFVAIIAGGFVLASLAHLALG
jgi:hypothetical protein